MVYYDYAICLPYTTFPSGPCWSNQRLHYYISMEIRLGLVTYMTNRFCDLSCNGIQNTKYPQLISFASFIIFLNIGGLTMRKFRLPPSELWIWCLPEVYTRLLHNVCRSYGLNLYSLGEITYLLQIISSSNN